MNFAISSDRILRSAKLATSPTPLTVQPVLTPKQLTKLTKIIISANIDPEKMKNSDLLEFVNASGVSKKNFVYGGSHSPRLIKKDTHS